MNINHYIQQIKSPHRRLFFKEALSMGITIEIMSTTYKLTKFTFNNKNIYLIDDRISFNTKTTATITKNKEITKMVLRSQGISVPAGIETSNLHDAQLAIQQGILKYPLVVKPIDGAKGIGITLDINTTQQLKSAIELINKTKGISSDSFIVEEMFYGCDFRVLILNNKIIACANRIPPHVIGNGENTIQELINDFNKKRSLDYLLHVDNDIEETLKDHSFSLETILPEKKKFFLRTNTNISSGGIAVDCTTVMSKRFKNVCLTAAKAVNGSFIGIDLFTNNISSEEGNQPYSIIEINGAPGYAIHEKPVINGHSVDVSKKLLEALFEE